MKIIDLEAHFRPREYDKFLRSKDISLKRTSALNDMLLDLGEGRLTKMDANGIDMEALCLCSPHVQHLEASDATRWAKTINDRVSAVVKNYPHRFIGMASLALQSPNEAADELERAVTELGHKGLCIQSHANDEYLDDRKYWVIFERAEKLDIPIFMHPTKPAKAIMEPYTDYGFALYGPAHGFSADLSLHVMRLMYGGLFDEYPKLKIILGHLGEGLPYYLTRIDHIWDKWWAKERPKIEKKPSEYIKTNFTVTISGTFFQPALICAYLALGSDNISFAVDYPYEENEEAIQFMKEAPISDIDKEKIYHVNAERLFKL